MGKNAVMPLDIVHNSNEVDSTPYEKRILIVALQRHYCTMQFAYGMMGIILMIIQMEYAWNVNTNTLSIPCPITNDLCTVCINELSTFPVDSGAMILNSLRLIISTTTLLMAYYQVQFYNQQVELLKVKNAIPKTASLWQSPLRVQFLVELVVTILHPMPLIEEVDPEWPHVYIFLCLVMFFRCGMIARIINYRSALNTSNGWFIASLTNVDFTPSFYLKTALKNNPGKCISLCLILLLFIAGYCLYGIERFMCVFVKESCCEPLSFLDAQWMLVITILTIGYGDVIPHTHGGRFIAIFGGLMGTLLTAVIIALTTNYLNLTRSEHKVNTFLQKNANKKLLRHSSAKVLQSYFQYITAKHKSQREGGKKKWNEAAELKLFNILRELRKVKRYISTNDGHDPMDKQMTMLEAMETNVEDIKSRMESIVDAMEVEAEYSHYSPRASSRFPSSTLSIDTTTSSPRRNTPPVHVLPNMPPDWVSDLQETLVTILEQVNVLSTDLEETKVRVNLQMERTDERFLILQTELHELKNSNRTTTRGRGESRRGG